jgi:ABC-2 type transport system permease protein
LAALGVFFPFVIGADWLQQAMLPVLWAWVAAFMATSIVIDAVAGERERHTLETLLASRLPDRAILLGKVGAATLFGWSLALLSALVGAVTVNVVGGRGQWLFYPADVLALGVLLSLLAAGLSAMAGVLVALRAPSARLAAQVQGAAIMALLLIPILASQAVPAGGAGGPFDAAAIAAAAVLAALDGVLLAACLARFRRGRIRFE